MTELQNNERKEDFHFVLGGEWGSAPLPQGGWRINYGKDGQYSFDAPADAPVVLHNKECNTLLNHFNQAGGDPLLLREHHKNLFSAAAAEVLEGRQGKVREVADGITCKKMRGALRELFLIDQKYNSLHALYSGALAASICKETDKYFLILQALGYY